MKEKFAFLQSVRFYKGLAAVVIVYLGLQGIIDPLLANLIAGFLGLDITINTVDRFSKK